MTVIFDFEALEAELRAERSARDKAEKDHKSYIFSIAHTLMESATVYAGRRTPPSDMSNDADSVYIAYDKSNIKIRVISEDRYTVHVKDTNDPMSAFEKEISCDKREMMSKLINFIAKAG